MNETIVTISIFLLMVIFVVLPILWRWNYCWKGILKDKIIKEERGTGIDDGDYSPWCIERFILIFETFEGEIIREKVSRERFDEAKIGDQYEKIKWSWKITKI